MNIRKNNAGCVSDSYILSKGFKVFDVVKMNDMGQAIYELPQYCKGDVTLTGGYWTWYLKQNGNIIFEGWWNSNEEFDNTLKELKL